MAESGGVGAAHILGWVVTAIAFAGNLLWNFKNREHSNRLAETIRREHYQKEVWDRCRNRIEERLEDFVEFVATLPASVLEISVEADKPVPLGIFAIGLNTSHDALSRALTEADNNSYCHGSLWAAKGYGRLHNHESAWDLILSLLSQAEASISRTDQVAKLKEMNGYALEIEVEVRTEIRQREYQYQP